MLPRYLRISVTARCNLRCSYCRGRQHCAADRGGGEPRVEELALLARCAAEEGVCKVRITGGEPLLRHDLARIVGAVSSVDGIEESTLTTNGIGLAERAGELGAAGLDRVNVSLDTLRPKRFRRITGSDRLSEVLEGVEACRSVFSVVKLNTVLLPGVNDDEVEPLVEFAARLGLWIRFVECYDSPCRGGRPGDFLSADVVEQRLRDAWGGLEPVAGSPLSVERSYVIPGAGDAKVGLISSVTAPPCGRCSRLRFTASGELLPCLFANEGIDLSPLLARGEAGAVRRAIQRAFERKKRPALGGGASVHAPVSDIGG